MRIVIMCAGKSKRFGTHKPKCLAEVGGQPNLDKTIDMLWKLGHYEIKVTYPHDKKYYFDSYSDVVSLVEGHNFIESQRFNNAFPLTERTVYLYGDGCISLDRKVYPIFSFVGSKDVVYNIAAILKSICNINNICIWKTGNSYRFKFGTKTNLKKVKLWLYKDATIYLKRKYEKMNLYIP